MKVILLEKVPGTGEADDIKEVSEGYARNFLFPRHLAVPASARSVANLDLRKKKVAKAAEEELKNEQSLAEALDGLEIEFAEKTSDKGLLYAAISPARIARRLSEMGFEINKQQITSGPLKSLGEYPIKIKFSHGLEAELKIVVTAAA